jgi:hypothetical protein
MAEEVAGRGEKIALIPFSPSPRTGEGEKETLSHRLFWERETQGVRAVWRDLCNG